jgi:hypothetical protein
MGGGPNNWAWHDFSRTEHMIHSTDLSQNQTFMESAQKVLGGPIEALGQWLDGVTERAKEKFTTVMNKGTTVLAEMRSQVKNSFNHETPALARSQQISPPEKTPQIAPDIVASAKDACVGMPTLNYASFANDFNPSPSASPVVGFGVAQSYGMSAG